MGHMIARLAAGWAVLGGVLVLSIMAVTSINVSAFTLDRIVRPFGIDVAGLPGYEDYVRLAVSSAALMFFPLCQARRGHVTVDLFVSWLPPAVRQALDRLWLFAIAGLAAFLAYWMTIGMLETRSDGALSPVLGWPEWPFYAPGVLSLLLWAAVALSQILGPEPDA
ncbi:MAG: TRAP transporter small permease [Roseibium sp.]|nr:TRAP transporter small permease [Roseibium sp.]